MNIGQAAQQSGLSLKQIRDYEKQGLLPNTTRSLAGYRRFGEEDIQRLQFIRHARDVGFSLAQITQLLALQDDPVRRSLDVNNLTAQHIDELNQKIQTLTHMRDTLQVWHDQCLGNEQSQCCILEGLISAKK